MEIKPAVVVSFERALRVQWQHYCGWRYQAHIEGRYLVGASI
jgi:hypothetical protein